jgi:hypothetical protein
MKLNVLERIVALSILPQQGDFATLKVLQTMRMSLSFTEEEFKKWGISENPDTRQTSWKVNGEEEIPLGEKATDILIEALKAKNKAKALPFNALTLYEKFIPS